MNRRQFIRLSALAATGLLAGCAANPVTGQSQLMLVSEAEEIQIDKKNSPYQLAADYGVSRDADLAAYVSETGKQVAAISHRPQMPYNFHAVNATYINAYAFPGGTIAVTRGILLKLDNEAELAALLGHEIGHVNARHTAQQMSKGTITQAIVGGIAVAAGTQGAIYGDIASQVGMIGAGALLASYSRDNEREADSLGLAYMTKAGYGADGFVGLMDVLNSMNKRRSNAIELMFSTHPMSSERYQTAVNEVHARYATQKKNPLHRERYMDRIANLRAMAPAIEAMQKGDAAMAKKQFARAAQEYRQALKTAPGDYTALVVMAKCQIVQEKFADAAGFTKRAVQADPQGAQAHYLNGLVHIQIGKYETALAAFGRYDRMLPGNPQVIFYKGLANEKMGRQEAAAKLYYRYLQQVRQGENAQHAYRRLVEWGYVKR
jgi:predicted Zn-dependent protease